MSGRKIKSVRAQQVYTKRGHPGVEAIVTTENGDVGRAMCTAGLSVGSHEIKFSYDGGERFRGRGVMNAVNNVNNIIAPALIGIDCADQYAIDSAILSIMPNAKVELGGNATASVSAAALKAGAAALDIPLYRHIGGANAIYLPVPGVPAVNGHARWGGGVTTPGGKPTYSFMCFGFDKFCDASYAGWEIQQAWDKAMAEKHIGPSDWYGLYTIPAGIFNSDEEIWALMTRTIEEAGYAGRVGIQVDVASDTYYCREDGKYHGLFSSEDKTPDDLFEIYKHAVDNYPFVIIEDPFFEDDYENHAKLTQMLDIQIVGDDLFTTDIKRVEYGSKLGAANTVLLKVNQIGTISEALDMIQFAYKKGYGVMPCESRGEGPAIADYCVGINACAIREMAINEVGNRLLEIEWELGKKGRFMGQSGLIGRRFK